MKKSIKSVISSTLSIALAFCIISPGLPEAEAASSKIEDVANDILSQTDHVVHSTKTKTLVPIKSLSLSKRQFVQAYSYALYIGDEHFTSQNVLNLRDRLWVMLDNESSTSDKDRKHSGTSHETKHEPETVNEDDKIVTGVFVDYDDKVPLSFSSTSARQSAVDRKAKKIASSITSRTRKLSKRKIATFEIPKSEAMKLVRTSRVKKGVKKSEVIEGYSTSFYSSKRSSKRLSKIETTDKHVRHTSSRKGFVYARFKVRLSYGKNKYIYSKMSRWYKIPLKKRKYTKKVKTSIMAKLAHEKVKKTASYTYSTKYPKYQTCGAWGALVKKKTQCLGYAKGFKEICNFLGVKCRIVVGDRKVAGKWNSHAWNEVRIDGRWIPVDCTTDDTAKIDSYGDCSFFKKLYRKREFK